MSDFDIININSKRSFVASLQKRKAFGLLDSDSDSDSEEDQHSKKRPQKKKTSIRSLSDDSSSDSDVEETKKGGAQTDDIKPASDLSTSNSNGDQQVSEDSKEATPQPNPYLQYGPDLDLIKALSSSSATSAPLERQRDSTTPVVNISDDEQENKIAEIENLDPELQALLYSSASSKAREPEKITVRLQYVHNYSSLSERTKTIVDKLLKPMKVIIMDNTQFDKILDVFCSHKKLKKSDLVLVYNNDTLFLTGTPVGVGMTPTTSNIIQVYPKNCYETLLQEREQQKQERLKKWAENNDEDEDDAFDSTQFDESEDPPNNDDADKFVIVLRSNDKTEIRLRVKSESTIGSVIDKYKELQKISNNISLSFEGEVLDPESTVGDADMEEGVLVEIISK